MSSDQMRKFINLFEHVESTYNENENKVNPIISEILEEVKNNASHPFKNLNPKVENTNILSFDIQAAIDFYGRGYAEKILEALIFVDWDFGSNGVENLKEENGRIYYEFADYKDI